MLELVSVAYLHPQYSTVLHQWEYHASSVLKCDTVKSPRGSKKKQHGHLLLSLKQQLEIALGSMSRGPARQHVLWTSQAASPVDQPGRLTSQMSSQSTSSWTRRGDCSRAAGGDEGPANCGMLLAGGSQDVAQGILESLTPPAEHRSNTPLVRHASRSKVGCMCVVRPFE